MAKDPTLQSQIERLLEDESITKDLQDAPAQVLLGWGVRQLQQGQPEAAVRRSVHVLARLVRDRRALSPGDARARMEAAGLTSPAADDLDAVWAEGGALPEDEWARRLVDTLTLSMPAPAVFHMPSPTGGETLGSGEKTRWWQRLLFWRRAP